MRKQRKRDTQRDPLYRKYYNILQRCNNKNHPRYNNWGGRGVKCLWKSFDDFRDDMEKSFKEHVKKYGLKETTIERVDVDGDYSKENCIWATWDIQYKNRRKREKSGGYKLYKIDGKLMRIGDIKQVYPSNKNINNSTIAHRVSIGWNIKDAILAPLGHSKPRKIEYRLFNKLPKREREFLILKYKGETLEKIGNKYGITRQRASQICKVAQKRLDKIRKKLVFLL